MGIPREIWNYQSEFRASIDMGPFRYLCYCTGGCNPSWQLAFTLVCPHMSTSRDHYNEESLPARCLSFSFKFALIFSTRSFRSYLVYFSIFQSWLKWGSPHFRIETLGIFSTETSVSWFLPRQKSELWRCRSSSRKAGPTNVESLVPLVGKSSHKSVVIVIKCHKMS